MGDRAVLYVKGAPAASYLHWCGGEEGLRRILDAAAPCMRKGDPSYAAARLAGECHVAKPGALGVGLVGPPTEADSKDGYVEYSHGDAGVCVIDVDTGEAEWFAGYMKGKKFTLSPCVA